MRDNEGSGDMRDSEVRAQVEAWLAAQSRAEDGSIKYDPNAWVNPELVRGVGVITPPRKYTDTRVRPARWAARDDKGILHKNSVKVTYADGTTVIRDARKPRKGSFRQSTTAAPVAQRVTSASLPSIRQGEVY